jgi:hypothetical protein
MSNVSNRHTVVPFVSGETKALSDQRLAKIGYKPRGKNAAKFPSVAVSVPQINPADITENVQRLLPYIGTMLEGTQDAIIRSMYEGSNGQLSSVADDDISINACIAFLEAEATGSRLTAEKIKEWFVENLTEPLTVYIAQKLGFDDPNEAQMETIGKNLAAYRDTFAVLSGKMVFLEQKKINSLLMALSMLPEECESDISAKLTAKLQAMNEKPVEDLI